MSIPFSRTTHSLNTDPDFRSLMVIGVLTIILLLWGQWFFFGTLRHVIHSNTVAITNTPIESRTVFQKEQGVYHQQTLQIVILTAQFHHDDANLVAPDQTARIIIDHPNKPPGDNWSATVVRNPEPGSNSRKIFLRMAVDPTDLELLRSQPLQARIEVSGISPAQWLLQGNYPPQ